MLSLITECSDYEWCPEYVLSCVQISFALGAAGFGATLAEWRWNKQDF